MFVLGTAGHVDHGKSTLVHALTGIDPDRLREEKARGMTIDLGFAWLRLPSGREVSIVDVPGHERFIKNMLAGVGGIDLALLIVAADEGVMPQTREHLAILDLLRVREGIVVVTKRDLVDTDWLDLVVADIEETIAPTSLIGSPIVGVSAATGDGLPGLLDAIDTKLTELPERSGSGRARLPIDRVFTISGFGTVVTGTLIDGRFSVGDEVVVLPAGQRTRLRGLQTHRTKVDRAEPGSRVAANLAGLATTDLRRGDVLAAPGWLRPTSAIDVRLRVVADRDRPLRHNTPVTFHVHASERNAKVRLLDTPEIAPGESGWAQIRLDDPVAVMKGDLFVIRSANDTIGGGEVVESHAKRHRRNHAPTIQRLAALEQGTPEEIVLQTLAAREPIEASGLTAAAPLPTEAASAALKALVDDGQVRVVAGRPLAPSVFVISAGGWERLVDRIEGAIDEYHGHFPLRAGMPKEELRQRIGASGRLFGDLLDDLRESVVEFGTLVRSAAFEPHLSPLQQAEADRYLAALRDAPYAPPTDSAIDAEVLAFLIDRGDAVRAAEGVVFASAPYREMVDRIVDRLRDRGTITVADVRDLFGTSRKYALSILNHLDERKITRRVGDDRILRQAGG